MHVLLEFCQNFEIIYLKLLLKLFLVRYIFVVASITKAFEEVKIKKESFIWCLLTLLSGLSYIHIDTRK